MDKIVRGISQYQEQVFPEQKTLFKELSHGQHPRVLFITCSDSRIDPTALTQVQPGELFILRNAGNIVPPFGATNGGEAATIEYAVSVLKIPNIIICGHPRCGAMSALHQPEATQALPAVNAWLGHASATRSIMRANYSELEGESLLEETVRQNVLVQIGNLRTHPSVAAGLAKGDLHLFGWTYRFETAEVSAHDPETGEFVPLEQEHMGETIGLRPLPPH